MNKKPMTHRDLKQRVSELEKENSELKRVKGLLKAGIDRGREVNAAIEENTAKFRAIVEHSPLAIMFTDAAGTITTCNDNASKLFGAPKKKLTGFSYRSIRDELMRAAIERALAGQQSRFEGEYLTVTGNVLTHMNANFSPAINPDGSVAGVIGIFEDISERRLVEKDRERLIRELRDALSKVKRLSGFLPICASCKKIRDDKGYWNQIELYIRDHSEIDFSHGICPECAQKLYPDMTSAKKKS